MTTNSFFKQLYDTDSSSDQQLVEDLIVEMIQIHGTDFFYLPRTLKNFDSFFGEDQKSAFKSAYALEFYLESAQNWEGQGNILSKFGLEIREEATLCCSIKRFEQVIGQQENISRPREGDIIAFPRSVDNSMRFFEITSVDNEEVFYQLGKIYVYKIRVKTFEYAGENIDTGNDSLDQYEDIHQLQMEIELEAGSHEFDSGEIVTQSTGFSATVVSCIDNILLVNRYKGELAQGLPIVGLFGNRIVKEVSNPVVNDSSLDDNKQLENAVKDSLIVNEYNPMVGW